MLTQHFILLDSATTSAVVHDHHSGRPTYLSGHVRNRSSVFSTYAMINYIRVITHTTLATHYSHKLTSIALLSITKRLHSVLCYHSNTKTPRPYSIILQVNTILYLFVYGISTNPFIKHCCDALCTCSKVANQAHLV